MSKREKEEKREKKQLTLSICATDLVRELIRLRSQVKRQKTDEESFLHKITDLRKRLNESDVQRMSVLIKNMMSLKELLQISNISIERYAYTSTRTHAQMWHPAIITPIMRTVHTHTQSVTLEPIFKRI